VFLGFLVAMLVNIIAFNANVLAQLLQECSESGPSSTDFLAGRPLWTHTEL